ncbi:hypothetical protein VST7929_00648 [Vibrio stylophorae]|uniref:ABC transmembrane type-1 domain-containing protein n=1 Tax=Vibrio stylophorae TaxID=659351 RepID=A0ABN8DNP9_9VIBR|nr:hypothetical protein VST7929_00648 [Vibrio stylophorae]
MFSSVAYMLSHQAAFQLMAHTRQQLVRHLAYAPLAWINQQGSGALKQMVLQSVAKLEQLVAHRTAPLR